MTTLLRVRGRSVGQELVWANTLIGREYEDVDPDVAVDDLLEQQTEKAWSRRITDVGSDTVSLRFDAASVWSAIAKVAETLDAHVREAYPLRQIDLAFLGAPSGVFLENTGLVDPSIDQNQTMGLIQSAQVVDESYDVVNVVIPLGQGEGNNAFTLYYSDRTVAGGYRYEIKTATGPGGIPYYYIEDEESIARYGRRLAVLGFKDIAPLANTITAFTNAANALYDLAATSLHRSRFPQATYNFGVAKLRNLFQVGDTLRVVYNGLVDDGGSSSSAVAFLRPMQDGHYQQWAGSVPSPHYQLVDDVTADDDTTWVRVNPQSTPNAIETYRCNASGIEGSTGIAQITLSFRARRESAVAVTAGAFLRLAGGQDAAPVDVSGTQQALSDSWTTYTQVWTSNPHTGKPWKVSEIDGMEVGFKGGASGNVNVRVTQVQLQVDYTRGGRRTWKNIDQDLVCLEKQRDFDSSGNDRWRLQVSTVDRWRQTSEEIVVGALETLAAVKHSVKAYTYEMNHGSERESIQFSGSHWFNYRVTYDQNVRYVLKTKLSVQLVALKANATGAASGGGVTSNSISTTSTPSGGGSTSGSDGNHSHDLLGVTNNYNATPESTNNSDGPGGHTHATNIGHNHSLTAGSTNSPGNHTHSTPAHTHNIDHTHTVPTHTHSLTYGIFTSTLPTSAGVRVYIDSGSGFVDRTAALSGPWDGDFEVDITQFVTDAQGRPEWGDNAVQIRKASTSPDAMDVVVQVRSLVVATGLAPV